MKFSIVFFFLIFVTVISFKAFAISNPIENPKIENQWDVNVYGESYTSITRQVPILFSRWMIDRKGILLNDGTFKIGFENYTSSASASNTYQSQWTFSAGYYYSFAPFLTIMTSLRAENINKPSNKEQYTLRSGILGGTFDFLKNSQTLFIESYYESYLQSLSNNNLTAIKMGSASVKLGYRWDKTKSPLFFDPIIIEIRGFSANRPELAGDSYSLLNLGPRLIYYHESPLIYSSLFITQSLRLDQKKPTSTPWILFTFGGRF